jgi:VWFA-related protein
VADGTVLSNTATVSSVTADPMAGNESATATTTVDTATLLTATKTVAGTFEPGSTVTYTVVVSNPTSQAQADNPGDELTDTLPSELTLVSATATSGTAVANVGTNTVTWNGAVPANGSVTLTIQATVDTDVPGGTLVANQTAIFYDADGDGTNESAAISDDPSVGGADDPTAFTVVDGASVTEIPRRRGARAPRPLPGARWRRPPAAAAGIADVGRPPERTEPGLNRRRSALFSMARRLLWSFGRRRYNAKTRRRQMRRLMARPALLALSTALSVVLGGGSLAAQEAEDQTRFEGDQVNVNEVLLDVLVTDRQGNVILGLDKDDFVVREDGKPVDLTGLTFYSSSRFLESKEEAAKKGLAIDRSPQDRFFILFFDDQRDSAADSPRLLSQQLEAGRRAAEWIREELAPADWVAVVSYSRKLKVHQDFTHDRRLLEEAINDAVRGKDVDNTWPSRTPKAAEGWSLLAGLPQGRELRDKTPTIYEAIQILARAAGNTTGRKNLVLFTTGFGQISAFGLYKPDPRYYPPMMQTLNDNNVAVYTIDMTPAGTQHVLANSMGQLADDTGGRYLFNFTNFATPLRQIAEENSGYYLLSYASPHPAGKKGFQKVKVTTTNPEFRIKTRDGYEYGG